jgi:hypothetical protein
MEIYKPLKIQNLFKKKESGDWKRREKIVLESIPL